MIYEIHKDTDDKIIDVPTTTAIEQSYIYPGYTLKTGSTGDNVAIIQSYLNAIKNGMFPSLPLLKVDGKFGNETKNSVTAYQGLSGLKQDGIIGKETWDAIVTDYTNLPAIVTDQYPGYVLNIGKSGPNVKTMQTKLNTLSTIYGAINYQSVDSKYGNNMANAVRRFQSQFGLKADSIIGKLTWDKIVDAHANINENKRKVTTKYPGYILTLGSNGDNVRFIQSYLNYINSYSNSNLPKLAVDGIYGNSTKQAVEKFQQINNLKIDGIVGKNTWDAIIKQFNLSL